MRATALPPRATGGGARPRTGLTRWPCSNNRTRPVTRTSCPSGTGACWYRRSPFYRGAAKIMAADLSTTPAAGLGAQLCGDAHLSNFGAFASPERALVLT